MEEEAVNREQVRRTAWSLAKRIALLAVLAVVVVGLQSVLGYLGDVFVVFFLALAGIFLARCVYALLQGLTALVSRLFGGPGDSPKAIWLFTGIILNTLEVVVCLVLAVHVLRATGWYTEVQLPDPIPYQLPQY